MSELNCSNWTDSALLTVFGCLHRGNVPACGRPENLIAEVRGEILHRMTRERNRP